MFLGHDQLEGEPVEGPKLAEVIMYLIWPQNESGSL